MSYVMEGHLFTAIVTAHLLLTGSHLPLLLPLHLGLPSGHLLARPGCQVKDPELGGARRPSGPALQLPQREGSHLAARGAGRNTWHQGEEDASCSLHRPAREAGSRAATWARSSITEAVCNRSIQFIVEIYPKYLQRNTALFYSYSS